MNRNETLTGVCVCVCLKFEASSEMSYTSLFYHRDIPQHNIITILHPRCDITATFCDMLSIVLTYIVIYCFFSNSKLCPRD